MLETSKSRNYTRRGKWGDFEYRVAFNMTMLSLCRLIWFGLRFIDHLGLDLSGQVAGVQTPEVVPTVGRAPPKPKYGC